MGNMGENRCYIRKRMKFSFSSDFLLDFNIDIPNRVYMNNYRKVSRSTIYLYMHKIYT